MDSAGFNRGKKRFSRSDDSTDGLKRRKGIYSNEKKYVSEIKRERILHRDGSAGPSKKKGIYKHSRNNSWEGLEADKSSQNFVENNSTILDLDFRVLDVLYIISEIDDQGWSETHFISVLMDNMGKGRVEAERLQKVGSFGDKVKRW